MSERIPTEEAEADGKKSANGGAAVDFDALLPHIGEFGRYQIVFYLLMCVPTMPAAFLAFNQVFLSAVPDHWCHVPDFDQLETDGVAEHLSLEHRKVRKYARITREPISSVCLLLVPDYSPAPKSPGRVRALPPIRRQLYGRLRGQRRPLAGRTRRRLEPNALQKRLRLRSVRIREHPRHRGEEEKGQTGAKLLTFISAAGPCLRSALVALHQHGPLLRRQPLRQHPVWIHLG